MNENTNEKMNEEMNELNLEDLEKIAGGFPSELVINQGQLVITVRRMFDRGMSIDDIVHEIVSTSLSSVFVAERTNQAANALSYVVRTYCEGLAANR